MINLIFFMTMDHNTMNIDIDETKDYHLVMLEFFSLRTWSLNLI